MNRAQFSRFVAQSASILLLLRGVFWAATIRNFVYARNRKLCQLEREVRQSFINSWIWESSLPVPHRSLHVLVNLSAVGGTACLLFLILGPPLAAEQQLALASHCVKEFHGAVSYCCCVRNSYSSVP
jgi:hypothetical protein